MNTQFVWLEEQFSNDFLGSPDFESVRDYFGPETLSNIDQYGAILITPDALAQNLLADLYRWFERWDAKVISAVPFVFSAADTMSLYGGRTTHNPNIHRIHSKWLSMDLLSLGSSVMLILKRQNKSLLSLQSQIKEDKGPSLFELHSGGQVRDISRISDRCFSLVHTPDDYEGFFHDTLLIMGKEGLKTSLATKGFSIDLELMQSLYPFINLEDEPHPLDLIFRLLERGLALLLCDPVLRKVRKSLPNLIQKIKDTRLDLLTPVHPKDLVKKCRKKLDELGPDIASLSMCVSEMWAHDRGWKFTQYIHSRIEMCKVLHALCIPSEITPELSFSLIDVFRRNYIPLNKWEKHRIHILLSFHQDFKIEI